MKKLLLLLICLLFTTPAFGVIDTVCDSGCTYTSLSTCANAADPGDTCSVESNGSYSGWTQSADGTSGNFIIIEAANGYSPTISSTVTISGTEYFKLDGFSMGGSVETGTGSLSNCGQHIVLTNLDFDGVGTAIEICSDYFLISDCTFNNMSNDAVRSFGSYGVIRNSSMITEDDSGDVHMDFWQSWGPNGLNDKTATYNVVENNEYRDVTGGNVHFALTNDTSGGDDVTKLIFRYNKVHDIGSRSIIINTENQTTMYDNTVYNNTFSKLYRGAETSDYAGTLSGSDADSTINNIFVDTMQRTGANGINDSEYSDYNLYYDSDGTMTFDLPASGESNKVANEDPLLADPDNGDYSIPTNSPAKNAGGPLTTVAVADSGSGTSLVVVKAEFFQDGWSISGVSADYIAVGTVSNTVQISSINYGTDTITLVSGISRSDSDPVWLYKDSDGTIVLYGSAPDIGAEEFTEGNGGGSSGGAGILQ